jgi:hypothetical protein
MNIGEFEALRRSSCAAGTPRSAPRRSRSPRPSLERQAIRGCRPPPVGAMRRSPLRSVA